MVSPLIARGRVLNGSSIPDQPLPNVDGPAELIVYVTESAPTQGKVSIFDLAGRAPRLRLAADIDEQLRAELDVRNDS